jgi:hypothetical protein
MPRHLPDVEPPPDGCGDATPCAASESATDRERRDEVVRSLVSDDCPELDPNELSDDDRAQMEALSRRRENLQRKAERDRPRQLRTRARIARNRQRRPPQRRPSLRPLGRPRARRTAARRAGGIRSGQDPGEGDDHSDGEPAGLAFPHGRRRITTGGRP